MSLAQAKAASPFYFKSYDSVVGVARNASELRAEVSRLAEANPGALEYHLKEGHIALWLDSLDEKRMAQELKRVLTVEEARAWARNSLGGKATTRRKVARRARGLGKR